METEMLPWPEYSHFAASLLTRRTPEMRRSGEPAGNTSSGAIMERGLAQMRAFFAAGVVRGPRTLPLVLA